MKKSNAIGFFTGFLAFGLIFLAGCKKSSSSAEGQTDIRVVYWGNAEERNIKLEMIQLFEKEHPHIKIKPEPTNWPYLDKVLVQIAGNNAPDVFLINETMFADLVQRGAMLNLDDFVKENPVNRDDIDSKLFDPFVQDGHLYGIPNQFFNYQLYYNKDVFEKNGVKTPKPDWTWEEVIKIGQACTHRDPRGKDTVFGLSPYQVNQQFFILTLQHGGKYVSSDGKRSALDGPEARKSLQFLVDLRNKYGIFPSLSEQSSMGGMNLFQTGRVAMQISGQWLIPELKNSKIQWGCLPLPRVKGRKPLTLFGVHGFVISPQTKHAKEAYEFIKFTTDPKAQELISKLQINLPASRKVLNALSKSGTDVADSNRIGIESLKFAEPGLLIPGNVEVSFDLTKQMEECFFGKKTVDEAIRLASKKIDDKLAETAAKK